MECIKLSEFIKHLEDIYRKNGELDLYSWNGKVVNLETFVQVDDQIILIDQQSTYKED